ncbi:MAG: cytochrome c-type biogenesis protein [Parvularculaceae bacterium]
MRLPAIAISAFALMLGAAHAVEPGEKLADPALEARARSISKDIRCVVCQSENIDDSNAPLAHDMRVLIRERLQAGDTDREAVQFLVDRYGDYVLLKPRVQTNTLVLWMTPTLAALIGAFAVWRLSKNASKRDDHPAPLTDEEKRALGELER